MRYGCIGEVLKHSFSKEIHNSLADYEYEIKEVSRDDFDRFASEADFCGINVTIPYKEMIIPYVSVVEDVAAEIGAVNTVVNKDGKLWGYNTDLFGLRELFRHAGVSLKEKKVAILGTGGTSKTAMAAAKLEGAREFFCISRSAKGGAVTYDDLYRLHSDVEIIINTTPVGMFPNIFASPIDLERFPSLCGVIDAVYNPLRTPLVLEAKRRGIAAEGGLYMLVSQAVRAAEIFGNKDIPTSEQDTVYNRIYKSKENIVLIGMPASGKSTVGRILSKKLNRELVDTDRLIEEECGKSITDIFKDAGEAEFRHIESEVIAKVASRNGLIIATGGGAILNGKNIDALRENGRLYFIDRPLKDLVPTKTRPLSSTREAIEKRYNERYGIYLASADVKINADCEAEGVAKKISEDFEK